MMMHAWLHSQLDELCEVTSSKRIYAKELCATGVPFYRSKEIIEKLNGQEVHSNPLFISEVRYQEILRLSGVPVEGDLLLTSRGTLGIPYIVIKSDRFHFADGNLTWFRRFRGLDSHFLKFFLLSPLGKAELARCVIGSSQLAYTIATLKKIAIPLPPIAVQKRIAGILSAYDELIVNNQRRIRILEEMARSLYREWFVYFRYPGHESVSFVDSSLGQIPLGWEVKRISDFGKVITGKTPSKANSNFYGDDVPFVKTPDMHGNMFLLSSGESLSNAGAASQANKIIPSGSICVSCIGTIGVVSITTDNCQTNQQINSIVLGKDHFREFLFYHLQDSKQALENLGSNGATMGNVNKSKFESLEVIAPPRALLERYHQFSTSLFYEILIFSRQTANLRRTRDLLLPRLLSGNVHLLPEDVV